MISLRILGDRIGIFIVETVLEAVYLIFQVLLQLPCRWLRPLLLCLGQGKS